MLIVTQLSDAYGRHLIFTIAIWTGGAFGVAAALAPSMTVFAAIRFVTGVFSVVGVGQFWSILGSIWVEENYFGSM